MRKYEVMFIVKPDLEETEINKVAEEMKKVLTDKAAKILEEKKMGQRELAYEIQKFKTGYYFLYVVEADANSDAINEFDRIAKINENVIRHLVIKVED
ncbi:MAG: 30S ribosomal protein S6 [Bacilli bacterium]